MVSFRFFFLKLKHFLLSLVSKQTCRINIQETMQHRSQNTGERHLPTTSYSHDLLMTFWPLSLLPAVSGAFFFIFFTVSQPSFWLQSTVGASQGYHTNWVIAWHDKMRPFNYPVSVLAAAVSPIHVVSLCLFFLFLLPCCHCLAPFNLCSQLIVVWGELEGTARPSSKMSCCHVLPALFFV